MLTHDHGKFVRGTRCADCGEEARMVDMDKDVHSQVAEAICKTLKAEDWLPHIFHDPDFRACIEACDKILTVKGRDYTQGRSDSDSAKSRLANFFEAAVFLGITPLQSLGNYWFKHLTAIFTFLKKGQVESEPIEGRLYDCINYMLLMYKMIQVLKRDGALIGVTVTV